MNKLSYAAGMLIGKNLLELGLTDVNSEEFTKGFQALLRGEATEMTPEEAGQLLNEFIKKQEEVKGETMKLAGQKFLEENAKKEDVITTASGLQYQVIKEGTGKKPKATDTVRCHYRGTTIDGKEFDSSYKRNQPADFGLMQVIAGWTEGLQLMSEGSTYRFFIPFNLGYGTRGAGAAIPPYATLIFDVELIKVL